MQRYLVTYDISDPRRLRKVFETLKGFGLHLQLSVFLCDLTRMGVAELRAELNALIHAREDQVLFVDLGPADGRAESAIESLGRAYSRLEHGPVVV
jgi:CRISPR-associated protein Cas2